ncbi:carbonic anhydrase 7 [Pelomyxa schiedti]|nr:carbonic anhydrase 7 [Pelomyxa schiedti]
MRGVVAVLVSFFCLVRSSTLGFGSEWGYEDSGSVRGPARWYEVYPACGTGAAVEHQSPINIDSFSTVHDASLSEPFVFGYKDNVAFNVSNVAYSILVDGQIPMDFTFVGPRDLQTTYKLISFHFHWHDSTLEGSEHTIDGVKYPLELHLVHIRSDFADLHEALLSGEANALSVVAVLYTIGEPNTELQKITDAAANVPYPGNTPVYIPDFTLKLILPSLLLSRYQYFLYSGSLTTPGCNEVVQWVVMTERVQIAADQLSGFRAMHHQLLEAHSTSTEEPFDVICNARPVQPLNGRTVIVGGQPSTSESISTSSSSSLSSSSSIRLSSSQPVVSSIEDWEPPAKADTGPAIATLTLSLALAVASVLVFCIMLCKKAPK